MFRLRIVGIFISSICNSWTNVVFYTSRLAAADQAARARDKAREDPDGGGGGLGSSAMGKRRPGGIEPGQSAPSSLFIFSDSNFIRRTTKFLIEWPYPNLPRYAQI